MKKTDTKRTSITPLTEAQRELVENNMRLVDYTIKTYFPASIRANSAWYLEYQDLRQSGMIGLCIAASKFIPDPEHCFSSYAIWRIRKAIMKSILGASKSARHETDACIEWADGDDEHDIINAIPFFDPRYTEIDTDLLLQQLHATDRNKDRAWCKRNFEMFRLRLEGYDYESIAKKFDTTPGNVRMYCVRARRSLQQALERSDTRSVI